LAVETPGREQSGQTVPLTSSPELEARLVEAIEPWLQHMTWRADFERWRERRIWQEDHQEANLRDIRTVLGGRAAGVRLLDLGAGMGGLSVALLREFGGGGLALQATDYNPSYAHIARLRARRYGLDLPVTVAAGEKLPYAEGRFDIVLCLDVLEHVRDVEAVLGETYRVLKPGGVVLTTVPNRRAFRDPHYHLPLINWLPAPLPEMIIERAGRSKSGGPLQDRQEHSELNTYTWGAFSRLASGRGFRVRDQVRHRISSGDIRQLHGWRRALLVVALRLRLVDPLYRAYRYGWQGTYQVMLVKPR
jgi:2-polyprenyl-3-methyl-5-hydroxy-6-metoxy-1,4-benzoquinol methylase